jgi:hypothetical protein
MIAQGVATSRFAQAAPLLVAADAHPPGTLARALQAEQDGS